MAVRLRLRLYVGVVCLLTAFPVAGQRQVGVRPTGAYWGAGPEQIDTLSGNLNFSLPVLELKTRAGFSRTLLLTYNSQNWFEKPMGVSRKRRSTWDMATGGGYPWARFVRERERAEWWLRTNTSTAAERSMS